MVSHQSIQMGLYMHTYSPVLQILYTNQLFGEINSDFIRIVAKLVSINLEVIFVTTDSWHDKMLKELTKEIEGSYPMLEIGEGQIMCDSLAIVAYISRISGNEKYLGADVNDQNEQIKWMKVMRESTHPLVESLKIIVYGETIQNKSTLKDYEVINLKFEENILHYQSHLKNKRMYLVNATLTISDIFFVLMLVDMYQTIMDPQFRS